MFGVASSISIVRLAIRPQRTQFALLMSHAVTVAPAVVVT